MRRGTAHGGERRRRSWAISWRWRRARGGLEGPRRRAGVVAVLPAPASSLERRGRRRQAHWWAGPGQGEVGLACARGKRSVLFFFYVFCFLFLLFCFASNKISKHFI